MMELDFLDPRTWELDTAPDTPVYLCLSSRWDIHCVLDYQDYLWAREHIWCHTYGSGSYTEKFEDVWVIDRPDKIYARRCVRRQVLWMHREILKRKTGWSSSRMIGDHMNGNTLDNRRVNLRWATRSQNAKNIPGSKMRLRFNKRIQPIQVCA